MSSPLFDAMLKNWCVFPIGRWVVLVGVIEDDAKGRFPDERLVRTSPLRSPRALKAGQIVETANSKYLLVGPKRRLAELKTLRPDAF